MGTFSIWHWLIVLVVVLVLFGGRGKLSQLMGDMAKGITAFKKGLKDENAIEKDDESKVLNSETSAAAPETIKKDGTA
ncbi:twin-arginine translocase TatA/TatE family subunit [Alphaproteobacteria bacterium]|nr:twin-arginine translocase TatA/TatE family subunit [Alphaproteobacteria bacterium]